MVSTEPPGSLVAIKDDTGRIIKTGVSPVEAPVSFQEGDRSYVVEATPTNANVDRYLATTHEVTEGSYLRLMAVSDNMRQLHVALDEKEFISLAYVEVVLDNSGAWRGFITRSRAFKDVAEVRGRVPSKIVDFGKNLGIEGLALSPDGDMIVYSVANYARELGDLEDAYGSSDERLIDVRESNLKGVNIRGGGIQQITSESFRDMYPNFTADGQDILFTSNRRRANSADILRMSTTGRGGIANIYVDTRDAMALKPTQSKDGTIAFALRPYGAPRDETQIWTLGGVNSFPTQIARGTFPQISPYGDRIAYVGVDGNLWVVNVDGSNQTQLTFEAERILERFYESLNDDEKAEFDFMIECGIQPIFPYRAPSWSPDGEYILFTAMEGTDPTSRHNEDIWFMRYDGSGKQQLTTNGSADRFPLLSPDMKWVYFMSNRGERWAVWRMEAPSMALSTSTSSLGTREP